MFAKLIASFALISSAALVSPALATESRVERLAVHGSAECPAGVLVGLRGDSFVSGVRFTVATKDLIAPGARLEILGVDATTLVFTAPLKEAISNCVGSTEQRVVWSNASFEVVFHGGSLSVSLHNASPSLRIDLTSTFNNQAIFDLSERL